MIYAFEEIKQLHLEISSRCNAECPLCPRTFFGYPIDQKNYTEHNMTINEAKKIFQTDFLQQIESVLINGNFGDLVMNPHAVDICQYFKLQNPKLIIDAYTNGGARDSKFWRELARLQVVVSFAIDGLEDTHSIYRRNTVFSTVMKNAQTFIQAGGTAIWKMIKFEHNLHQVDQCQDLSKKLGFSDFRLIDQGRDTGPVFNKEKKVEFILKPDKWNSLGIKVEFNRLYNGHFDTTLTESKYQQYKLRESNKNINCWAAREKSIYVNSIGEVYPCCWTGMNPRTFRNNSDYGFGLTQINDIMSKNNALDHPLRDCVSWFGSVENGWSKSGYGDGRLMICDQICGSDK